MKRLKFFLCVTLAVVGVGFLVASAVEAAITTSGDVTPTPSSWSTSTSDYYVGNSDNGSITIDNGSSLNTNKTTTLYLYLGNTAGIAGTINITGAGSSLDTTTTPTYVGYSGTGVVNVRSGGNFISNYTYLSSGTINIDGVGSALTNTYRLLVGWLGTGKINVSNGGTLNTENHDGTYIGYTDTGLVAVDGAGSTWNHAGTLSISLGYNSTTGYGMVSVTNGGTVNSTGGYLINKGLTTVDGVGSSLTVQNYFRIRNGNLNVLNGGTVTAGTTTSGSTKDTIIGYGSGDTGKATVDGVGSQWTNSGTLYVGNTGSGTRTGYLSIADGGAVVANAVSINAVSTFTTDVGYGSTLAVGSGGITNNGTIRLVAGAGTGVGTYSPITNAGSWSGNTPQALGGVWNDANHTVTVNAAATAAAGAATTFDLASTQRVLITDAATGQSVGAAFQAATAPTNLTITATAIADLAGLKGQLASGTAVLSAWDFTITQGYTSGSPVYLSLFAGSNQSLSTLSIWHYDGSTWSAFTANDLAYDGTYASFTATGFSGYAVSGTAPVPIPAAVWLLGSGLAGLVGMRRRLFRK
jgi:T5SS/PEP-CTERM-associated repeat protein